MFKKHTEQLRDIVSAEICLDGQTIAYTLRRSKSARYARLRISADGGLIITLPQHYHMSRAEEIILDKKRWIKKRLEMVQMSRLLYADNNHVQYLGRTLSIHSRTTLTLKATVQLAGEALILDLPASAQGTRAIVTAWLRTQAQSIIPPLVAQHSQRMNITYSHVRISTARTRWGSCSLRGTLNFNWKLIMLPVEIIEYVVVHELCHLSEMNHSPNFWKLVEQYCPDWRVLRHWLRRNESALIY
ncbi:MAG: M48 family metallopeptidase [Dehalococcoidia bacterium]|nr:M48 family metallopeptidase [Dehalococcoidia bacterium]